jgi:choline kinase
MKAIILAAGRGSRMLNLTENAPKCMVQFRGKSLLQWQVEALSSGGITEIGIVTGYKREALREFGLEEFYNARWSETNMVYSLQQANEWLCNSPCVVAYSDIFYTGAAVRLLLGSVAPLTITYDPYWLKLWQSRFENPLDDAETFRVNSSGDLLEIGGKPGSLQEVQGQYMGLLRFTPQAWQEALRVVHSLPESERNAIHMTATLQRIIDAQRVPIRAVPYDGEWFEFDSASDLSAAELEKQL